MTQAETIQLLRILRSLWPDRRTVDLDEQKAQVIVWAAVMADVEYSEAQDAVVAIARSGVRFPPAAGEIVSAVAEAREKASGLSAPSADEAWTEVIGAIHERGWQQGPPEWSHPAVRKAARAIGWNDLCHGSEMVTRAHFMKLYAERRRVWVAERSQLSLEAGPQRAAIDARSSPVIPPA